jgi:hypothetical protein
MAHYVLTHTLKDLGLVDVNTVIAWYYGELLLIEPARINNKPVKYHMSWHGVSARERHLTVMQFARRVPDDRITCSYYIGEALKYVTLHTIRISHLSSTSDVITYLWVWI